jgi:hypothetical protein
MTLFVQRPFIPCPNVVLSSFEYICLKIATNPLRSANWYLKKLNGYITGNPRVPYWDDYFSENAINYTGVYFTNKYSGAEWISSYTVTAEGLNVAKKAAQKIGLTLPQD